MAADTIIACPQRAAGRYATMPANRQPLEKDGIWHPVRALSERKANNRTRGKAIESCYRLEDSGESVFGMTPTEPFLPLNRL